MTLNEKFIRRIRRMNWQGREQFGKAYVSFWHYVHFIRRVDLVMIDHDQLGEIIADMCNDPEKAQWN